MPFTPLEKQVPESNVDSTFTPSVDESVYRQETGRVITAPSGLDGKSIEYLDDTQNNGEPTHSFFGFTNIAMKALPYTLMAGIALKNQPVQVARGAAGGFERMIPDIVGGLAQNFGEVMQERKTDPIFKGGIGPLDALAAIPGLGDALTAAGKGLIEKNNKFLDDMGLSEQKNDGFAFTVGQGFGSVGTSVAMTMITKNPTYAAALFGAYQKTQIYQEMRAKQAKGEMSGGASEAGTLSTVFAIPETVIELMGGKFMLGAATSKPIVTFLKRVAGEVMQETSQQASEETLALASGLRSDIGGAVERVATAGVVAAIVGAPVHMITHTIEARGKKENLSNDQIGAIIKRITENKSDIQSVPIGMIADETNSLIDDSAAHKTISEIVAKFKSGEPVSALEHLSDQHAAELKVITDGVFAQEKATLPSAAEERRKTQAATTEGRIKLIDEKVSGIDNEIVILSDGLDRLEAAQEERNRLIKDNKEVHGAQDEALQAQITKNRKELSALSGQRETFDNERSQLLDIGVQKTKQEVLPSVSKFQDINQWLRSIGGVIDAGGEIRHAGGRGGLINDGGTNIEHALEMAIQEGFLPEGSDVNDFLDAISETVKGRKVFRETDAIDFHDAAATREARVNINEKRIQVSDEIKRRGFDKLRHFNQDDIEAIVEYTERENISIDEALDEVGSAMDKTKDMPVREILFLGSEGQKRKMAPNAGDKVTVTASKLDTIKQRVRDIQKGFREGAKIVRENVKAAQEYIIGYIEKSGLSLEDRAKFIKSIKNIQTEEQFNKHFPAIQSRVMKMLDTAQRNETIEAIRKTVRNVKNSNVIAVDFAKQIEALFQEIDTKKRSEKTLSALQKTFDYMQKNPDANMPKDVLKKLEILNKKPLEEISTSELQSILGDLQDLVKQGKTKLGLMIAQRRRIKEKRLEELKTDSVRLTSRDLRRALIGERLTIMNEIKNKFAKFMNAAQTSALALNPMDVFYDMLDDGKGYKGANHRIFKQTIDVAFSKYLNLKESATRDVKNLVDKLGMTEQNLERIGVYAAAQQDGGVEKLKFTGITQEEIDGVKLTAEETQVYELMRKKLDAMFPAIQEIMRLVYNKDVVATNNYFSFMTDYDSMKDFEIQNTFGDDAAQFGIENNLPITGKQKNVQRGFTISRTGGKQKIRIDALGVFLKHIDNAAYLIEMGGDIKALGELAISPEYKDAVGDVGQEMVVEWVTLLARKGNVPGKIAALDVLRKHVGTAVLGFKLSSALIQPTALADGATLVGGGYVARGVTDILNPEWRKFLMKNLPELRERVGDDPGYMELGGDSIIGKVNEAGTWALRNLDLMTASAIASGAYTKSVEERGEKVDLSNPDPIAIQEAQLMMRRTQSSIFAKDMPPAISRGGLTGNVSVDKMILQFQSFMLNRWSLIKHDMWELGIKNGDTAKALNIATWILLANAAEVGIRHGAKELVALLLGLFGYKDDSKPWEDTIAKEVSMTVLGNVPFVSDAVSNLALIPGAPSEITQLSYYSNPIPVISLWNQINEEKKLAAISKKDETKLRHQVNGAILITGALFGVAGTLQTEQIVSKIMKPEKKSKQSTP